MASSTPPLRALIVHTNTSLRPGRSNFAGAVPNSVDVCFSHDDGDTVPGGERLIDRLRQLPSTTQRVLSSGETLHAAGQPFDCVSMPLAGCFKVVSRASRANGRMLSVHLRGDWIALDAMVSGWHAADVVAVGSARVMVVELQALGQVCREDPDLCAAVQASIRRALAG